MTLLAPPPTISSFSPASGCGNSTSVVITGTNFTGATAVTFGGVAAQSFVVNNATQITAVPASGNTGTISVTTLGGSGTSAGTFTVNTPPTVTVTASTNPICSGSSTTLTAVGANMGGGGSYLYNPGALAGAVQTVSPVTSTVYTVTATAVNGCTGTTSISISVTPIAAAPNPVTATPTTICPGGTSQLNSTSIVNATQTWYTVPSGGVAIGTSLSGVNFPVTPAVTTTYYVETFENIPSGSQTFNYTGGLQTFTVPAGITSITVDAFGAQGGGNGNSVGGLGGNIQTTLAVTGGQILNVYVGGQGLPGGPTAGGYNGGGASSSTNFTGSGGGASDVRVAPYALANRLVVAGAGGGAGLNCGSNLEMGGMGGRPNRWYWMAMWSTSFLVGLGGSQVAGGLQGNNQDKDVVKMVV
ncbi:MAG: hypothetical protein IPH46_09245 [Bacteroidetes bacterium]|nr:hypothetical protein [Bacteroidota bacterium]